MKKFRVISTGHWKTKPVAKSQGITSELSADVYVYEITFLSLLCYAALNPSGIEQVKSNGLLSFSNIYTFISSGSGSEWE